jgi:hypothetical protein
MLIGIYVTDSRAQSRPSRQFSRQQPGNYIKALDRSGQGVIRRGFQAATRALFRSAWTVLLRVCSSVGCSSADSFITSSRSTHRSVAARAQGLNRTTPLIRVRPRDLAAAGVARVARTVGVRDGLPLLEDGQTLDVANVIWCTGYVPGFHWIDLPVFGEHEPLHERGIVPSLPGLYSVGLHFQYALSSSTLRGVSRDARRVVRAIATRQAGARASSRQVLKPAAA